MSQTEIKPVVDQIETHPYFQQQNVHAYLWVPRYSAWGGAHFKKARITLLKTRYL